MGGGSCEYDLNVIRLTKLGTRARARTHTHTYTHTPTHTHTDKYPCNWSSVYGVVLYVPVCVYGYTYTYLCNMCYVHGFVLCISIRMCSCLDLTYTHHRMYVCM